MNNNLTLLYVEDDDEVRENFQEIFQSYFKNVMTADNGKSAMQLYNKHSIDVAILDISIPEINGLSVAQQIRAIDSKIELIMLTAYSDQEKLLKAVNLQLFSYLIKPVSSDKLFTTLHNVTNKLSQTNILDLGHGYGFDIDLKSLFYNNEKIKITKNEKRLLLLLSTNNNNYCDAEFIFRELFNDEESINLHNVTKLISRFKKKMLDNYDNKYFFIDNIYGLGYKLKSA